LLAAVLISTIMVVIQILALYCVPVVTNFYGGCTLKRGTTYYIYLDHGLTGILWIFLLIALFGLISWGIVRLLRLFGDNISQLIQNVKAILLIPLLIATIVSFFLLLPNTIWWGITLWWNISTWNSVLILFLGFFFLNAFWFFLFEGMTYEEYTRDLLKPLPNTI